MYIFKILCLVNLFYGYRLYILVYVFSRHYHEESSSDQYSDSDQSFTPGNQSRVVQGREVDGASACSSPNSSNVYSPHTNVMSTSTPVSSSAAVGKDKTVEHSSCKLYG